MNEKDLHVAPSKLAFTDTLRELQSGNSNITVDPAYIEPLKKMGMLNRQSTSENMSKNYLQSARRRPY